MALFDCASICTRFRTAAKDQKNMLGGSILAAPPRRRVGVRIKAAHGQSFSAKELFHLLSM
jgi:hypothetical protein